MRSALRGLVPISYRERVTNLILAQIGALNTGGASAISQIPGLSPNSPGQSHPFATNIPYDGTRNASLDIQHTMGRETLLISATGFRSAQAYDVFNHAEISGINTGISFNHTTNQVTNTSALGCISAATSARIPGFTERISYFPAQNSPSRELAISGIRQGGA